MSASKTQDRPVAVSVPIAAAYLDCSTTTVRRMIASGQLPATRLGVSRRGTLRIRYADLDAVLNSKKR